MGRILTVDQAFRGEDFAIVKQAMDELHLHGVHDAGTMTQVRRQLTSQQARENFFGYNFPIVAAAKLTIQ